MPAAGAGVDGLVGVVLVGLVGVVLVGLLVGPLVGLFGVALGVARGAGFVAVATAGIAVLVVAHPPSASATIVSAAAPRSRPLVDVVDTTVISSPFPPTRCCSTSCPMTGPPATESQPVFSPAPGEPAHPGEPYPAVPRTREARCRIS